MLPLDFCRTPLLFAAACFAAGESLTRIPSQAPRLTMLLAAGAAALLAVTVVALRRALRITLLPVAAFWIAIGLWSAQLEPRPTPNTALLAYADGLSRTVKGTVVRVRELPPRALQRDADRDWDGWDEIGAPTLSVDVDVNAIEDVTPDTSRMLPIRGGVRMSVLSDGKVQQQLQCGDRVQVPVRLRIPQRYHDPGVWQYADYLLDQGISATAAAPSDKLQRLAADAAPSARCRVYAAQSWAGTRMLGYARSPANRRLPKLLRLTADEAGMLNAMLFGDRTRLNRALRLGFERTGSFHLFVVSGLHIAVLAGLLMWLARRLGLAEWPATVLTLVLLPTYALLTGFGVPVQRALLMATAYLITQLLARERNPLNALGAAALAVLVWSPHALFEASFQMTFLSIVAIAGIAVPIGQWTFVAYINATRHLHETWRDASMPPHIAQFRVMLRVWREAIPYRLVGYVPAWCIRVALRVAELALISIIAEAVMVLPMALYFHRITVLALPANIFSIPLVAVLVPLGLATFLGALVSPWLAVLPGSVLTALLHTVNRLVTGLASARVAGARTPGPTVAAALLALGSVAFCCWAVRRSRLAAWASAVALPLAVLLALWPAGIRNSNGMLEITAIDVGQGDSLLVVSPGGHAMLIDAGGPTGAAANAENATSTDAFDIGEEVVSPYLWSRQVRRLDILALTHAHSDHMGGMAAVLRNFHPRELWVGAEPDSDAFRDLLAEATELGIAVRHMRAGDHADWDGVELTALAPAADYANSGPPVNNDSLVLRLQYGRAAALLEGDAESSSEQAMVASARRGGPQIGPDVLLKVGHHGSRTSTSEAFVSMAAPKDAVISVGRGNSFGHPRPEIIARLAQAGAKVFRTDEFGLTRFVLSSDGRIAETPIASNE